MATNRHGKNKKTDIILFSQTCILFSCSKAPLLSLLLDRLPPGLQYVAESYMTGAESKVSILCSLQLLHAAGWDQLMFRCARTRFQMISAIQNTADLVCSLQQLRVPHAHDINDLHNNVEEIKIFRDFRETVPRMKRVGRPEAMPSSSTLLSIQPFQVAYCILLGHSKLLVGLSC